MSQFDHESEFQSPSLNQMIRDQIVCIVCGCSDFNPCIDERTGESCAWIEFQPGVTSFNKGGLCSFCAETRVNDVDFVATAEAALRRGFEKPSNEEPDEPLVEIFSDYEATQYLRARSAGA